VVNDIFLCDSDLHDDHHFEDKAMTDLSECNPWYNINPVNEKDKKIIEQFQLDVNNCADCQETNIIQPCEACNCRTKP
jgi:hypothetical protein